MCLSGAVVEQNSKSIKQLVHLSPWLSPGKIYWLRQQLGHTRTSSFLCGWLDTESHMSERPDLFHMSHYQTSSSGSSAVQWNSALINSDLLIFTEISLRFYIFPSFLKKKKFPDTVQHRRHRKATYELHLKKWVEKHNERRRFHFGAGCYNYHALWQYANAEQAHFILILYQNWGNQKERDFERGFTDVALMAGA